MARKLGMGFLGAKFWSMDFFGFCLKPKGFCWVLIFAPFDHPCHLKPEVRPSPPPPTRADTPARTLRYRWPFSSLLALHSGSASCDDTKNGLLRRHCPCTTKAQKGLRKSEVGSGKWEVERPSSVFVVYSHPLLSGKVGFFLRGGLVAVHMLARTDASLNWKLPVDLLFTTYTTYYI